MPAHPSDHDSSVLNYRISPGNLIAGSTVNPVVLQKAAETDIRISFKKTLEMDHSICDNKYINCWIMVVTLFITY